MHKDYTSKIVSLPELLAAAQAARQTRKTIVCCHGCFDIVHPGHLRYLQFARRQGNLLVVSLTGDASVDKGLQRPYIPQELRAENLAALELVDLVYVDPHATAAGLLRQLRPDVYVKGKEYQDSTDPGFLEERRAVEEAGGRVIFSSGEVVFSSSQLVESIAPQPELEAERLTHTCRRHRIDGAALLRTLKRMAGRRVVVAGDVILDHYVFCDAINVAHESPMMSLSQLGQETYLGGAAVVARHVARMGGRPFLLASAGDDARRQQAASQLEAEGIEHHFVRRTGSIARKTRFLVEDTKLLKVEDARVDPLDTRGQREAACVINDRADGADAVLFCDFGFGTLSGTWLERVLPELRDRVGVMAADVSGERANLLRFSGMDLMAPTERELRASVSDFDRGLAPVAWQVMNVTRCRHLFVTLGRKGVVVFDRQSQDPHDPSYRARLRSEHLPPLGQVCVDRLGCGDALLAAAALAISAGASPMQAAYLGSLAAALELRRMGNIPIDRGAMAQSLRARPELRAGLPPEMPIEPALAEQATGGEW